MSLRKAVNAKCKDCIYDPLAGGTWRKQVEECPCTSCPLYPVRPRITPNRPKKQGQRPKSAPGQQEVTA